MASERRRTTDRLARLPRGLFVTGTDTGVGKTHVGAAILLALRRRGHSVIGLKPIETGCADGIPHDAVRLSDAAGSPIPLDQICPYRFVPPISPAAAAAEAGRSLDLSDIADVARRQLRRNRFLLVEGAGGLYSPLTSRATFADLARTLGFPVIVVGRSALGTVNATLLTARAARAEGLRLAGIVLNRTVAPISPDEATNPAAIRSRVGDVPVLGPLPFVPGDPAGRIAALATILDESRLLSTLLRRALLAEAEATENRTQDLPRRRLPDQLA